MLRVQGGFHFSLLKFAALDNITSWEQIVSKVKTVYSLYLVNFLEIASKIVLTLHTFFIFELTKFSIQVGTCMAPHLIGSTYMLCLDELSSKENGNLNIIIKINIDEALP